MRRSRWLLVMCALPLLYLPLRAAESPPAAQAGQAEEAAPPEPVGLPERDAAADDTEETEPVDDDAAAEPAASPPAAREDTPREREPGEPQIREGAQGGAGKAETRARRGLAARTRIPSCATRVIVTNPSAKSAATISVSRLFHFSPPCERKSASRW